MRRLSLSILALIIVFMTLGMATASTLFPLEPPDTSSPKATLHSFLTYTGKLHSAMTAAEPDETEINEYMQRAMRCFNLSEIAPDLARTEGIEAVLIMREIMDRAEFPSISGAPDMKAVNAQAINRWRIPRTEIFLEKVQEGPRRGEFLFTPDTVSQLDSFYEEVRDLPYININRRGLYEEYIYSSGWMLPEDLLLRLPDWAWKDYLDQTIWQWTGLLLAIMTTLLLLCPVLRWHLRRGKDAAHTSGILRLAFPLAAMTACLLLGYFIKHQIHITGRVFYVLSLGLEAVVFGLAGWAIFIAANAITHWIIDLQHIKEEALDADLIRLVGKLVSFALVFSLFYRAGVHLGLSITAVFASAGVVGIAVALAARETLANFFGGISIFLDRPFKTGDFITLESGEMGTVRSVGMRSTRILTRDNASITIPNSVITKAKITNQSAPDMRLRISITIGVAYGSDLDLVERLLMETAEGAPHVMDDPAPTFRLAEFADSSINYKLRFWVAHPLHRGKTLHHVHRAIHNSFEKNGIEIPFPQRDIHLHGANSDRD